MLILVIVAGFVIYGYDPCAFELFASEHELSDGTFREHNDSTRFSQ